MLVGQPGERTMSVFDDYIQVFTQPPNKVSERELVARVPASLKGDEVIAEIGIDPRNVVASKLIHWKGDKCWIIVVA
jgi:hypothetical protein